MAERGAGRVPLLDWHNALCGARSRQGTAPSTTGMYPYFIKFGYFNVAMAVNTEASQCRARLLKADRQDFNAAANENFVP